MTDEELDKARAEEAHRIWGDMPGFDLRDVAPIAARLAREGWQPTPAVDPLVDALKLREAAKDYRESISAPDSDDMFSLPYQWQDKPHRHVWDLCKKLEEAADNLDAARNSALEEAANCVMTSEWAEDHEAADNILALMTKEPK